MPADRRCVELAIECQADITKTCCKDGKKVCPLLPRCGYYHQQDDAESVQVWIVASDMLFHTQKILGKPALVIIDEAIFGKRACAASNGARRTSGALQSTASPPVRGH